MTGKKSLFCSVEWLAGIGCSEPGARDTRPWEMSPGARSVSLSSPSSSCGSFSSPASSPFFDEQRGRAGSTSPDLGHMSCPGSPGSQHSSNSSSSSPAASSSASSSSASGGGGVTEEEGQTPGPGPRRAAGFCRRARSAFSAAQLAELESSFRRRRYLSVAERGELGRQLDMSDLQVKTWFQNRRMKQKREELCAPRGGGAFPHGPAPPLFTPPLVSWLAPPPAFAAPPCCPYLLLY